MAYSSAKHFSLFSLFFFFIAFLFFSAPQVNARDSKFFSKVTRRISKADNNLKATEISLTDAPAPAPELPVVVVSPAAPVPSPESSSDPEPEPELGYGLYGNEEGSAEVEGETLTAEQLVGSGDEGRYETRYDQINGYGNSNGKGNYYYGSEKSGTSYEQQGMSDTRFLENGRYYHDMKSDQNKQINEKENVGDSYYNNGFENNQESGERYVFDSMEEYEKYQENHGYLPWFMSMWLKERNIMPMLMQWNREMFLSYERIVSFFLSFFFSFFFFFFFN